MKLPAIFAKQILEDTLTDLYGSEFTKRAIPYISEPTDEYTERVLRIKELVGYVNTNPSEYRLVCVCRRTNKWAIYIICPYGVISPEQLAYAFEWPYDSTSNSIIFADAKAVGEALWNANFSNYVITEAFLDKHTEEYGT